MRTYRELAGVAEFRRLFLALAAAMAASTIEGLALATLVFDRTGSPLLSAVSMFGPSLAQVLGATLFMSAGDRLPPRAAMTGMASVMCLAALLMAAPGMPVPALLAVVLLTGVMMSVGGAVHWGLLSEILPADGYVLGRSVMQMMIGAMQIAGFAGSAVALRFLSPATLLVIAAGLYAGTAALSRFGLTARPARAAGRPSVAETWRINRRLWRTPGVPSVYLSLWVPNGLVVGAEALFVPYARGAAGTLFVADALGMLAGDAIMGRWTSPRWRARLVTPLRMLLAAPYLVFALRPDVPVAWAITALASAGFSAGLLLQERLVALTREPDRGHVLGLHSSGMLAMQGVGAVVAGVVAEQVPVGRAMAVMAALSLTVTVVLAPGLRRTSRRPAQPSLDAAS